MRNDKASPRRPPGDLAYEVDHVSLDSIWLFPKEQSRWAMTRDK
jgi:hypothetical protein